MPPAPPTPKCLLRRWLCWPGRRQGSASQAGTGEGWRRQRRRRGAGGRCLRATAASATGGRTGAGRAALGQAPAPPHKVLPLQRTRTGRVVVVVAVGVAGLVVVVVGSGGFVVGLSGGVGGSCGDWRGVRVGVGWWWQ